MQRSDLLSLQSHKSDQDTTGVVTKAGLGQKEDSTNADIYLKNKQTEGEAIIARSVSTFNKKKN